MDVASPTGRAAPVLARPVFQAGELDRRLARLRDEMARRGLDIAILASPENVFYLTGLDHWGYFAPHLLIVPAEGEMVLVTRGMERATIARHVLNARFEGHEDYESAAARAAEILRQEASRPRHIGIEAGSAGLTHALAETLKQRVTAQWGDVTGLVDRLRQVKSPAEQAYMRRAAEISDAAAGAAIDAIGKGASERDVAAACLAAMVAAGGTYPGFGPFIRSTARLDEEHTTWSDTRLAAGDAVFLELSGCFARYHAPLGRLVHVGNISQADHDMAALVEAAFAAVLRALVPGALFREVYAAWQGVVDAAGLAHYRRHHCGYVVGIGFPPSWTGGNSVTGLRHDSELIVEAGMSFHVLSWLMGTGRGDFFRSDTVLVGERQAELLTRAPSAPLAR
ncbi:M24 family metallopeptidase [Afifella pfennigii]|uniref:M24 family metallopeptidase n=1 Tax=Afifella pfennigii TaxID=209897 RepID=UPI0009FC726A|nr:Xaa-Pro peptidase family protein [Afifella pfennigii]